MRRLKSHFHVFKISLVHIITAWQPECQKLPKYQVLFLLLTSFTLSILSYDHIWESVPISWHSGKSLCSAGVLTQLQGQCLYNQACGVASSSKPWRLGVKAPADGLADVHVLAITHHGEHRPISLLQTSLANLVTSSHALASCRLLPRDHNKMGRSEVLSIPPCQVVTVALHQPLCN